MNSVRKSRPRRLQFFSALCCAIRFIALPTVSEAQIISGTVRLEACAGGAEPVTFSFSSATKAYFFTRTITLTQDDAYTFSDIPPDRYRVKIKGANWLSAVAIADNRLRNAVVSVRLLAGDLNKDNTCAAAAIVLFASAYGSDRAISGSGYNLNCDLNRDGGVDAADFGLLIANCGCVGAELPAGTPLPLSRILPTNPRVSGDTDPPAPYLREYPLILTNEYFNLMNEEEFIYSSEQPEKVRFEDDFTPNALQNNLVLATRNAARVRIYNAPATVRPGAVANAPGAILCDVKLSAAAPGANADNPMQSAVNSLHSLDITLTPGKMYHIVVDFDAVTSFETAPAYANSYGLLPKKRLGSNGLTLFPIYEKPAPTRVADKPALEKAALVVKSHEIRTARYLVTGEKDGLVKFADFQRKVFNHFQMDAGKWAREVFVLDDGKTVGASQEDHTVFWDAATGREIGRVPEHVYGFSYDQKRFLAQNGREKVSVYEYPSLKRVAQFAPPFAIGLSAFLFSPNDRYCALEFENGFPAPEDTYPNKHHSFHNSSFVHLYCLDPAAVLPKFDRFVGTVGAFAADSSAYLGTDSVFVGRDRIDGPWRFDLKTFQFEEVAAPKR